MFVLIMFLPSTYQAGAGRSLKSWQRLTRLLAPDSQNQESASNQKGLPRTPGPLRKNDRFGSDLLLFGAAEEDGRPYLAIGAPESSDDGEDAGMVWIVSAKSGDVIKTLPGRPMERFGYCVGSPGDIDNDGFSDLMVGSCPHDRQRMPVLAIYSGRSLEMLRRLEMQSDRPEGFQHVWGIGRWRSEAVPNIVAISPRQLSIFSATTGERIFSLRNSEAPGGSWACSTSGAAGTRLFYADTDGSNGEVYAIEAKDSKPLWTQSLRELRSLDAPDMFGYSLAVIGDLNGDGFDDIAVGDPGELWSLPGMVAVLSGVDGSSLLMIEGEDNLRNLGWSIARCGDIDRDGVPDVFASAPSLVKSYAMVYSGRTGRPLRSVRSSRDYDCAAIAAGYDLDGDGVPDLVLGGSPVDRGYTKYPGVVRVVSGASGDIVFELSSESLRGQK